MNCRVFPLVTLTLSQSSRLCAWTLPPQRTLCHTVEVEVKEFGHHQNHLQNEESLQLLFISTDLWAIKPVSKDVWDSLENFLGKNKKKKKKRTEKEKKGINFCFLIYFWFWVQEQKHHILEDNRKTKYFEIN